MNAKQIFNFGKRSFGSMYNYSSPANPRVYLTVAQGEKKIGEMVFELYSENQPQTADSFQTLCEGSEGNTY